MCICVHDKSVIEIDIYIEKNIRTKHKIQGLCNPSDSEDHSYYSE